MPSPTPPHPTPPNSTHIIHAVSAQHKLSDYLPFLKTNATLCLVGIPPEPYQLHAGEILMKRLKVGGSIIGGIKETQVRGCIYVCILRVFVCVCFCG